MPGNPLTDPNWAADLSEQIVSIVGQVREKTTDNAVKVVRGVVFGLLGLMLGIVAVALLLILLTRALQSFLDWTGMSWATAVYASYFIVGGILTLVGLLLMSMRHSTD